MINFSSWIKLILAMEPNEKIRSCFVGWINLLRTKDTLINRLLTLPGFCFVGTCDVVK